LQLDAELPICWKTFAVQQDFVDAYKILKHVAPCCVDYFVLTAAFIISPVIVTQYGG